MKEKTVQINGVTGIYNTTDSERLKAGDLVSGVNIEIDATGKPSRRLGATRRVACTPSSFWSDGSVGYFLDGSALKLFMPPSTISTLRSGLSDRRIAFAQFGPMPTVYYTNGDVTGKIDGGVDKPWGIVVPTLPDVAIIAGDLRAGWYGFTMTFLRSNGMESGAPRMGMVKVNDNGGFALANLQVSTDPDVTRKRVYITGRNGEEPFLVGEIPNSQTGFAYTYPVKGTRICDKILKGPPPAGHLLDYNNSYLFVARGSEIIHTEPFSPELCDLRSNYLRVGAEPTIMKGVEGGLYVATREQTMFLAGDTPKTYAMKHVLPYGAPLGNAVELQGNLVTKDGLPGQVVAWMSARGWVVGDAQGNVINLTERRYNAPTSNRAASVFKQRGGLNQLVSVLFN